MMNSAKIQNTNLVSVYTKQAGQKLEYVGRFIPTLGGSFFEVPIRKSEVRYNFAAVHYFDYTSNKGTSISFHARRDLAKPLNDHDRIVEIVEIYHAADKCSKCGNYEAIGKGVEICPACEAGGEDNLKQAVAGLLDMSQDLNNKTTDTIRDRLARFVDGEFIPLHVVKLDVKHLSDYNQDDGLKARVSNALAMTDGRRDWADPILRVRARLVKFSLGDLDALTAKLDLATLESVIGTMQDSAPSSFDANNQEMDEAITAGLDEKGYLALHDRIVDVAGRSKHLSGAFQIRARERLALYLDGKLSMQVAEESLGVLDLALKLDETEGARQLRKNFPSIKASVDARRLEDRDTQERVREDSWTLACRLQDHIDPEEVPRDIIRQDLASKIRSLAEGQRQILKEILEAWKA